MMPLVARVAALRIESFRGIPGALALDLRARPGAPPSSLLLLGDNGSGKSSIVDALEFVLRASLLRRLDPDRPTKRHADTFANKGKPYVEATYADGSRIGRGAPGNGRYGAGVRRITEPEPPFAQAPIVLKRADILGFWGLPPERRKLVFFDYFRPPDLSNAQKLEASRLADAAKQRIPGLERALNEKRQRLEAEAGVPLKRIPGTSSELRRFRRRVLVRDFGTGRTGRYDEALIQPKVQAAYRQALDAALALEHERKTQALQHERAEGTHITRVQAEVEDILGQAGSYVTQAFTSISDTGAFVDEIRLVTQRDTNELDVNVRLANGQEAAPEDVLSEANLDLLALLLFTAVAEASASHGQAKVLVLDDVFQSVDAVFRDRAVRYLVERLRDWQLFVTTHDRLWFALLGETLRQLNVPVLSREIVRWSFDAGPTIREGRLLPGGSLEVALEAADPVLVCASAGVLLEEIADRMSWTIGTSVSRRRGDRYTLGDLWPGVSKKLLKSTAAAEAEAVERTKILRNLVGAHFNDWARSVSISEATGFGRAVQNLLARTFCGTCHSWLLPAARNATAWKCKCGGTQLAIGDKA